MHTVAMRHRAAVAVFEFGHNGDETGDAVMLGLIVPLQDNWTIRQELARECPSTLTTRLEPLGTPALVCRAAAAAGGQVFMRAGETEAWLEALSVSQVHCSRPTF